MKTVTRKGAKRSSGFTLLEMIVATSIFTVLGYTLVSAISMAHGSHRAVFGSTRENGYRRQVSLQLVEELTSANSDSITVLSPVNENHTLTFNLPIVVDGDQEWGVRDSSISMDPDDQSEADWSICYTVVDVDDNGAVARNLVRQLLDEDGVLQFQTTVAEGISTGAAFPKGFSVVQTGNVWELTLTTEGNAAGGTGRSTVFHVNTRN